MVCDGYSEHELPFTEGGGCQQPTQPTRRFGGFGSGFVSSFPSRTIGKTLKFQKDGMSHGFGNYVVGSMENTFEDV